MIDFADFKRMFRGGLLLEDAVFEELAEAPNGVARGLKFIVVLALAVGLVVGLVGFTRSVTTSPSEEVGTVMDGLATAVAVVFYNGTYGLFGDDTESVNAVINNIRAAKEMALGIVDVVENTTPAPMAAVSLVEALGKWLSLPFAWIAAWLLWSALALLFARMLGGTATIQRMLSASSLVAAPHVLDVLGWVPCAGGLVGLLATLWGFVVFVKATAVANRFGPGSALVAVVLPIGIPLFLGIAFIFLIALLASGGAN